jgi:hypothetical protein
MHAFWLFMFAVTAGFTASGIIANVYRVCGLKADNTAGRVLQAAVLVVAGPNVLFEKAMRGFLQKQWKPYTFWLVSAGVFYWSLALGLLVLEVATRL